MDDGIVPKGISILLLFMLSLLSGLIPIWLHHRGRLSQTDSPSKKLLLDILNCFAGGVFLGTCLLHLLPEGREDFVKYKEEVGHDYEFPVYEAVAGVGILLVALVEQIGFAIVFWNRDNKTKNISNVLGHKSPEIVSIKAWEDGADIVRNKTAQLVHSPAMEEGGNVERSNTPGTVHSPVKEDGSDAEAGSTPGISHSLVDPQIVHKALPRSDCAALTPTAALDGPCKGSHRNGSLDSIPAPVFASEPDHHHHSQIAFTTSCELENIFEMPVARVLPLLVALSFHTVFDGLAVGLQHSATRVWEVLAAIAVHKALVALCLGLELAVASPNNTRRPVIFVLFFSLVSPIGVAIGMGVTSGRVHEVAQLLASSILQALATGTFIYVTFFEILARPLALHHGGAVTTWVDMAKIGVTFFGFACMAGVRLLDQD